MDFDFDAWVKSFTAQIMAIGSDKAPLASDIESNSFLDHVLQTPEKP